MGTCKDCRHWAGRPNVEDEMAVCRRFPPGLPSTNGALLTKFPVTLDTTTCGEFAARVPLPVAAGARQPEDVPAQQAPMLAAYDAWANRQGFSGHADSCCRSAFLAGINYARATGLPSPQES